MGAIKFNHNTTRYDITNALFLGQCSRLAYKSESEIKKFSKDQWGSKVIEFFDVLDTQAFLFANDEIIVVAFRGTESIKDWMTDGDIKLIKSRRGRVHRGFAMALNRIWKKLETTVLDLNSEPRPLFVTGHSLGGALATIAVDRFIDNKMDVCGLYTFG